MNIWLDWKILNYILKKKKSIYLFGRSEDWIPKTLKRIDKYKYKITILDNNPTYENTSFKSINVRNPNILKNFNSDEDFVIITAEPETIVPELKRYGLLPEKNFCCTPEIKEWGNLQNIKKNSSNIIFSSSDYFDLARARSSKLGGGIFLANVRDQHYEKKIDGQYRQVINHKDYYYVVEFVKKELHVFDRSFKLIERYNLDQSKDKKEKPNYCGITHIPKKKSFFVANAGSDEITIYDDKNFKLLDKIIFSDKSKTVEDGQCHINDMTAMGSSIIVSYFSRVGLWRKGIFDGGISEIETDNNFKINDIKTDLMQPHSPEVINGQIYVLDSLNKSLYLGTKKIAKFPGFVRGLSFDGTYFYIGQSEDMYLSQDMGSNKNAVMCNAGIYQFDEVKNISRYLSVPDVMNIHDLLVW